MGYVAFLLFLMNRLNKIESAIFCFDLYYTSKGYFYLQQLALSVYVEGVKGFPVLPYSADIIKFPDSFGL